MNSKSGMPPKDKMTATELRGSLSLASVLFLRMLGLFLILPVFTLYARTLTDSTPTLVGLAFGVYGLTQASLQIPFGMLSDKVGRKPVILAGLLIFIVGSLIASQAESIWVMIMGRALQGAGAISAALMALAADLTREQQRTKAMALIGISIGFAFSLAFIAGPLLDAVIGVSGIFILSALLAVLAMVVLYLVVPTPETSSFHSDAEVSLAMLGNVLRERRLLKLNLGIFILHAVLMANFIVVPTAIQDYAGLASAHHWQIYLPVLFTSIIFMAPAIIIGERTQTSGAFFKGAVLLLVVSQTGYFFWHNTLVALAFMLLVFFTAFNYLEASLPSLISTMSSKNSKGTALGVYASSQFIGTFTGGLIGGIIHEHFGLSAVFIFGGIMTLIWFLVIMLPTNQVQDED
ncbi:MAG: MFS transporter [Gammaproteobacteria bacterium]|nr:MAG: MFS transporter [Gammaproteobacteria bacterium]RKZ72052.1 MAG: MFS transporter [Gammaproteobacteria bacterium]